MATARQEFGIEGLDRMLGGGLLPGTLTVLAGATGAGKTQLGLRWADQGRLAEGRRVRIATPPAGFGDFNDSWRAEVGL